MLGLGTKCSDNRTVETAFMIISEAILATGGTALGVPVSNDYSDISATIA